MKTRPLPGVSAAAFRGVALLAALTLAAPQSAPGAAARAEPSLRLRGAISAAAENDDTSRTRSSSGPSCAPALQTLYGQDAVGLPPGNYVVGANGKRESVTVRAGAITEY